MYYGSWHNSHCNPRLVIMVRVRLEIEGVYAGLARGGTG